MSESIADNFNNHYIEETSDHDNYSHGDAKTYYRNLSLRYFAANPLQMLSAMGRLKEMCLEHGNPEAHYIEGLLQYFHHKEQRTGLRHLRESSKQNNLNGTYAYGLIMLAHGHYCKGMEYLDKLQWRSNLAKSDQCWERMKNSLREIPPQMTQRYYVNWVNLKPRTACCDQNNMNEVCKHCYYYKRLTLFVEFAGHDTT